MAGRRDIQAGRASVSLRLKGRNQIERGLIGIERRFQRTGSRIEATGGRIGRFGLLVGTGLAVAGRVFANFDDQIRALGAVSGASERDLAQLRAEAAELGRTTSFTAVQVAQLQTELAKAGFNPQQVIAMTAAVLDLSKATGTDAAASAGILASTIRQFNLEASDGARVADALTVAANNSFNTVEQLGEALQYAGPVAADLNLSLEDTLAILGALGNLGIQGSAAGTAVRRLLTLSAAEAAKFRETFGVEVKTAAGEARPLIQVLGEIQRATENLGNADRAEKFNAAFGLLGITAASALAKGGASVDALKEKLDTAAGSANAAATKMEAGLGGFFRRFLSGAEGTGNRAGAALEDFGKGFLQRLTDATTAVTLFIDRNEKIVPALGKVAVVTGVVGGGLIGLGLAAKGVAFAFAGLAALASTAVAVPAALAVGVAGVALAFNDGRIAGIDFYDVLTRLLDQMGLLEKLSLKTARALRLEDAAAAAQQAGGRVQAAVAEREKAESLAKRAEAQLKVVSALEAQIKSQEKLARAERNAGVGQRKVETQLDGGGTGFFTIRELAIRELKGELTDAGILAAQLDRRLQLASQRKVEQASASAVATVEAEVQYALTGETSGDLARRIRELTENGIGPAEAERVAAVVRVAVAAEVEDAGGGRDLAAAILEAAGGGLDAAEAAALIATVRARVEASLDGAALGTLAGDVRALVGGKLDAAAAERVTAALRVRLDASLDAGPTLSGLPARIRELGRGQVNAAEAEAIAATVRARVVAVADGVEVERGLPGLVRRTLGDAADRAAVEAVTAAVRVEVDAELQQSAFVGDLPRRLRESVQGQLGEAEAETLAAELPVLIAAAIDGRPVERDLPAAIDAIVGPLLGRLDRERLAVTLQAEVAAVVDGRRLDVELTDRILAVAGDAVDRAAAVELAASVKARIGGTVDRDGLSRDVAVQVREALAQTEARIEGFDLPAIGTEITAFARANLQDDGSVRGLPERIRVLTENYIDEATANGLAAVVEARVGVEVPEVRVDRSLRDRILAAVGREVDAAEGEQLEAQVTARIRSAVDAEALGPELQDAILRESFDALTAAQAEELVALLPARILADLDGAALKRDLLADVRRIGGEAIGLAEAERIEALLTAELTSAVNGGGFGEVLLADIRRITGGAVEEAEAQDLVAEISARIVGSVDAGTAAEDLAAGLVRASNGAIDAAEAERFAAELRAGLSVEVVGQEALQRDVLAQIRAAGGEAMDEATARRLAGVVEAEIAFQAQADERSAALAEQVRALFGPAVNDAQAERLAATIEGDLRLGLVPGAAEDLAATLVEAADGAVTEAQARELLAEIEVRPLYQLADAEGREGLLAQIGERLAALADKQRAKADFAAELELFGATSEESTRLQIEAQVQRLKDAAAKLGQATPEILAEIDARAGKELEASLGVKLSSQFDAISTFDASTAALQFGSGGDPETRRTADGVRRLETSVGQLGRDVVRALAELKGRGVFT